MRFVQRIRLWLLALFARRRVERDLKREMAFHITMEREKLEREGVPSAEADRRARVAFGGVQRFTEDVRDERGLRPFDEVAQDLRFAVRHFARAPVLTATIVAMLAVGIGANSVLIAFIESMTIRPPTAIAPDRSLARIRGSTSFASQIPPGELRAYRAQTDVFAGVAGWTSGQVLIAPHDSGNVVAGIAQFVTEGFFQLLWLRPALGQVPARVADSAKAPYVDALVSHSFWRRHLGSSEQIIGKLMRVGNADVRIVGVAPRGFIGAEAINAVPASVWLPISAIEASGASGSGANANTRAYYVIARLQRGVSSRRANAIVAALATREARESQRRVATAVNVVALRANNRDAGDGNREVRMLIATMGIITVLILAIICSNVSALVLGRAIARKREIAVRLSLGASRWRLVRQLVTESAVLAVAGGALGIAMLAAFVKLLARWAPELNVSVGWMTVAGTAALALGTGVFFGLSPALFATRTSLFGAIKDSGVWGRQHARIQRRLVVAQIALSQPLLVGFGVMLASTIAANTSGPNRDIANRTVVMELGEAFSRGAYDKPVEHARVVALTERLRDGIAEMPGVERVAAGATWHSRDALRVHDADHIASARPELFDVSTHIVGPGYFDLLGARIVRGRDFEAADDLSSPQGVIVGDDLARELWGEANPVGRRLVTVCNCLLGTYHVVGVVDTKQMGPSLQDGRMRVFTAAAQQLSYDSPSLLVRTSARPEAVIATLGAYMRRELPSSPVQRVTTLAQINDAKRRERMLVAGFASGTGVLALTLATFGLYAMVMFAVSQRAREIGIRIALGARRGQIVSHFLRDGVKLSIIGSAIGLPVSAFGIGAWMTGVGFRGPSAWATAAAIALLVTGVATLATFIPARRAALIDPNAAIRLE